MLRSMVNGFDREKIDPQLAKLRRLKKWWIFPHQITALLSVRSLTQERVFAFADLIQTDFGA